MNIGVYERLSASLHFMDQIALSSYLIINRSLDPQLTLDWDNISAETRRLYGELGLSVVHEGPTTKHLGHLS